VEENKITCPVCGDEGALDEVATWVIQEPYGSIEHFSFRATKCARCTESTIGEDYDAAVIPAMNKSTRASVINILSFFEENKYNKSSLERIFGLGRGTIDKYLKEDVIEPSFVMLLLTYRSFFPGLIDSADLPRGFNKCTLFGEEGENEHKH
jgi:hypothetical protein